MNPVAVSLLFNPVGAPGDGSLLRRFDLNSRGGGDAALPQRRGDASRRRGRIHRRGALFRAHRDRHGARQQPAPAGDGCGEERFPPHARRHDAAHRAVRLRAEAHDPGRRRQAERPDPRRVRPCARREPPVESSSPRDVRLRHDDPHFAVQRRGPARDEERGRPSNSSRPFRRTGRFRSTTPTSCSTAPRSPEPMRTRPFTGRRARAMRSGPPMGRSSRWRRSSTTGPRTLRSTWACRRSGFESLVRAQLEPQSASRRALASLPFAGGPAPLLFPTVHSAGAPLATATGPSGVRA